MQALQLAASAAGPEAAVTQASCSAPCTTTCHRSADVRSSSIRWRGLIEHPSVVLGHLQSHLVLLVARSRLQSYLVVVVVHSTLVAAHGEPPAGCLIAAIGNGEAAK
jgi:hypothetical protein